VVWLFVCIDVLGRMRAESMSQLAAASGWVLLASILLLSSVVYAHYFVPAVALAAMSQDARLRSAVLWLSLGGMLGYNVNLLSVTYGAEWLTTDPARVTGSLLLLAPPGVWLGARALSAAKQPGQQRSEVAQYPVRAPH